MIASYATAHRKPALPGLLRSLFQALGCALGGAALLAGLVGTYRLKMRLGLDLVPGVDMLPDDRIMAAIHAVAGLAGP